MAVGGSYGNRPWFRVGKFTCTGARDGQRLGRGTSSTANLYETVDPYNRHFRRVRYLCNYDMLLAVERWRGREKWSCHVQAV